jgi:hypothetical protein
MSNPANAFPNPPSRGNGTPLARLHKRQAFGLLERVGQELEPTPTQGERAETAYNAVGQWLADDPRLADAQIYAQGSIAHGTANKPIGRNEHDVDLIESVPGYTPGLPPASLKKFIGERLAAHDRYRSMLEEMPRCWRLNYSGECHLDITPSIRNPHCANGGELVPDRDLKRWKPSNPKGFRDLFARRADLRPLVPSRDARDITLDKAEVEPFPTKSGSKGILRVTVQILKRDRDIHFLNKNEALAPLSIIITTLASQAYEWCVTRYPYDNELDLMCDTIRAMPWFIEQGIENGHKIWLIPNETTRGENFAEKWNKDPRRATSFTDWHERALKNIEALAEISGLDLVAAHLGRILGERPVRGAMDALTDEIGEARETKRLYVASGVGLTTSAASISTPVRANTFYGR